MAAQFKVGKLDVPSVTGAQAISGVGFKPTAIIFYASTTGFSGATWEPNIREQIGFAVDDGVTTTDRSIGVYSTDNVATTDTARQDSAGSAITLAYNGTPSVSRAQVDSFDADGFTLNWTAVNAATDGLDVFYLAIGGVSASIVQWTTPTTAVAKSVTGVGFRPDLVFHLTSGFNTAPTVSAAHATIGFGAMDRSGGQWTNAWEHLDALAAADTYRYQRTARCLSSAFGGTVTFDAHFTSMDADGFTVTFDTAAVGGNSRYVYSLCLGGINAKVGAFSTAQSTTATQQAVTGVGFRPSATLFSTFGGGATSTIASQGIRSIGVADGTGNYVGGVVDEDAVDPTRADALSSVNKSLLIPTTGPATYAIGDIDSFDADGFTVGWDAAVGTAAFEMLYVALSGRGFTGFGIPIGI